MRIFLILLGMLSATLLAAADYEIKLTTSAVDCIVPCGKEFVFTAQALMDGKPAPADMTLKVTEHISGKGVKPVSQSADKLYTFKYTPTEPDHIYIKCYLYSKEKKSKAVVLKNSKNPKSKSVVGVGVYVAPEKQRIARQEPADFDAMWDKYKGELKEVPMKELERKPVKNAAGEKAKVSVYDIKVAAPCGKNVSGILCLPQDKSRKYPAIVYFHGAGVRSSGIRVNAEALTLDVNAHGLPNLKPAKFYSDITQNNSPYVGTAEVKAKMFHGMFMRVLRALEYVRSQPEWNGKDLIVTGGSQGGIQTITAAAQDKFVTLAVPNIPAMIGVGEYLCKGKEKAQVAWPAPYRKEYNEKKDVTAIAREFDYMDGAFQLRRVKCPIYLSVGMYDTHAAHVAAAWNDCPAEKKVFTRNAYNGHQPVNPAGHKAIRDLLTQRTAEAAKEAKK